VYINNDELVMEYSFKKTKTKGNTKNIWKMHFASKVKCFGKNTGNHSKAGIFAHCLFIQNILL
jgi:hypothetical protein